MSEYKYNPGSDEAIEKGCKCPVLDNGHGRGWKGIEGKFVVSFECPLHGEDHENAKGN